MTVSGDEAQEVIIGLREKLQEREVDAKVIYSGGADVDILPKGAGKGNALQYLLDKVCIVQRYVQSHQIPSNH